jgi:hypothetical protein
MNEGKLPIQYLGVPLLSKRLTATDCDVLVSKIAGRIDSWLARNMSFAGRLQLVSSVLLSMQVYWAKVFILPKRVIFLLQQKFNRFLWGGKDTKAHAKVSWEKLCNPKREGRLSIKNLDVWNNASILQHIWALFTKAGSLWVAWIEENRLKGKSLWQVSIPNDCSWCWKKLLKLRNIAKQFLSFKVGGGSQIFFWHDKWHPIGYLLDCFGSRAVHDSGIPLDAKVSKIIKGGDWYWSFARFNTIVDIQSRLPEILIGGEDLAVWHSPNGAYSCAATWDQLRVKLPVVAWWKLVWHLLAIPRHSFFLWLVIREAIVTKY